MEKLEARWPLLKGLTISLFFLYFYIKGRVFGGSEIYSYLDLTFGVYYHILILYPLILSATGLLSRRKEVALKIRLFSGVMLFFFCTFFMIMRELGVSGLEDIRLQQELIRRAWTDLKLGGLSTAIMHYMYFNINSTYLYRIVAGGIGVTSLILFTKSITNSIRWVIRQRTEYLERMALKKREEELRTKIKIKEEIDEKMSLKKERNLKSHEEKIQQEVEKFMMGSSDKPEKADEVEEGYSELEQEVQGEVISLEELVEYAKKQVETSREQQDQEDALKENQVLDSADEEEAKENTEQSEAVEQESEEEKILWVDEVEQEKIKLEIDEINSETSDKERAQ